MLRLEFTIEIERSTQDVFDLVGNPENDPKWQSAVVEVRKLTPGPIAKGTRYRHTLSILGKRMDIDVEFTARQPHTGYVLQSMSGPIAFETRVQMRGSRNATVVETVVEGRPTGVARIAAVALSRHRRTEINQDLRRLKQLLESRTI